MPRLPGRCFDATVARAVRAGVRLAAVVAVGSLLVAWGVAQWDHLLPASLTVSDAAAPSGTITARPGG